MDSRVRNLINKIRNQKSEYSDVINNNNPKSSVKFSFVIDDIKHNFEISQSKPGRFTDSDKIYVIKLYSDIDSEHITDVKRNIYSPLLKAIGITDATINHDYPSGTVNYKSRFTEEEINNIFQLI